jgi:enamine deaminase RidA (YjgF/YER057c/UK114 family)
MSLTGKLAAMNLTIPTVPGPFGAYVPAKRVGDLVYVAGQLPMRDGKLLATGPVPSKCPIEQAREAAKQCVINGLAAVKSAGVDLVSLTGVLRVGVFVCSDIGFTEQPRVANAASELLLELFGESGKHVRAAVGVNALPLDAAVEIEFIFSCA